MKILTSKFIAVALTCSAMSAAFARSPMLDRLEEMKSMGIPVDIKAYERAELYEKSNLEMSVRAQMESQKLLEDISVRIIDAYESALKYHNNSESARREIVNAISKDLELADDSLKNELKRLAIAALDAHIRGEASSIDSSQTKQIHSFFEHQSLMKAQQLRKEEAYALINKDDDNGLKKEFKSKAELVASLASEKGNAPYPSSSTTTVKSGQQFSSAQSISAQVSMEFLGTSISAGPSIEFKRTYATDVVVMGLGLAPVLLPNGNFDLFKRDSKNNIIKKNGKEVRREISFNCSAEVNFSSDYKGAGGFKVMGIGAGASVTKTYSNKVGLDSRRIAIPDYVAGKSVTMSYLSQLCHNDFLNARIAGGTTVKKALDGMMRNVISSLTFSHPQTKCATDNDCVDWYNNEVISWHKSKTFPRCAPEASGREKFYACTLRGLQDANCSVYKDGERTTSGSFEYSCDKGLKCQKTKEGGWFTRGQLKAYDEAKCKPINARTYVSPLDNGYIEINLAN